MKAETVRAKMALSLDPTRMIDVFSCGSEQDTFTDIEALAIVKRAHERLKKVKIASLIVTTKETRNFAEKRFEGVFSEFRDKAFARYAIDVKKTKLTILKELFERATNIPDMETETDRGQEVVFILFEQEVNEFFGDFRLSAQYEMTIRSFRERYPDVYFYLSYDTWRDATDDDFNRREPRRQVTEFSTNALVTCSTYRKRTIACFPPNPAAITIFEASKTEYEMLSLGDLLGYDEYERFSWAEEHQRLSYVSFLAHQAAMSGKQGELLAFALRCLVEYENGVTESLFKTSLLKGLGEYVHNVPANELLRELWNHPGLFKVVCEQYVLRSDKPPERCRVILDEVDEHVKTEALKAFEEGRFDSYTDVCIPCVKRDFSYSFCTDYEPKAYTISFHYQAG